MNPLSKRLIGMLVKVQKPLSEQKSYSKNHLLFIDDFKIPS